LSVTLDDAALIPYIMANCAPAAAADLAIRMAERAQLPGADALFVTRFDQLMNEGQFAEAARLAARSPRVHRRYSWP
jgi:clathrin heavy chain